MKKLILSFFIILIITTSSNAQSTYTPMLDSINHWTFSFDFIPVTPEAPSCNYPYWGFINGSMIADTDTVINTFSYKKMIQDGYCLFGFIREDTATRKVYFMDNSYNPEQLIYDFSMQIGDSLQLLFYYQGLGQYWADGYYVLDSIRPVSTYSGIRNEFDLNCHSCNGSSTVRWIEGIGNVANPIYTFSENQISFGQFGGFGCVEFPHDKANNFVTCFEHANKIYLDSCACATANTNSGSFYFTDSCHYEVTGGGIKDITLSSSIKLTANPFHEKTTLIINNNVSEKNNLKILDMKGMIVQEKTFSENSITIERKNLAEGVYIFRLTDDRGKFAVGKLVVE